mgnify:CR=1 FL=1
MPPDFILLSEPLVDDNLRLPRRREPLGIEHLAAQVSIGVFVVSVLRT